MRKLATIRKISEVAPIEGADAIEKVRVDGWWCVAKKGEFQMNDLCCYMEIDSLLPLRPEFAFMAKNGTKKTLVDGVEVEGYRLRTIKLRGQISQGLALPLSALPDLAKALTEGAEGYRVDDNVTEILGIHKYDPPIPACISGEIKGIFPGCIPKSDEERVQNSLDLLEQHKGKVFTVTEKLDGSSTTIFKFNHEFGICSRNYEMKENDQNTIWRLAKQYDLPNTLPDGWAIQGECCGEGIQKNSLKLNRQDIFVFYVFNIETREYLLLKDALEFVKNLGMKHVPVIDGHFVLDCSIETIIEMANGKSLLNQNANREGIVFRLDEAGDKISFKSISNHYLLKNEN
jgi:RNA ligase (TIGR02306 family)